MGPLDYSQAPEGRHVNISPLRGLPAKGGRRATDIPPLAGLPRQLLRYSRVLFRQGPRPTRQPFFGSVRVVNNFVAEVFTQVVVHEQQSSPRHLRPLVRRYGLPARLVSLGLRVALAPR